jgi:hypothetical protein
MTYTKPALATVGAASVAIQFQVGNKASQNALDAIASMRPLESTGTAYDLDE